MVLTRHMTIEWRYPVMAFLADGEIRYFDWDVAFTEYPQDVYRDGVLLGMELIDSAGEQWFVRTVDRLSPEPPPRRWWQFWPFWTAPTAVLELGVEKGGRIDFKTVRKRVCDTVAAEARRNGDDEEETKETLKQLRRARNYEDISDVLGLADAQGFLD